MSALRRPDLSGVYFVLLAGGQGSRLHELTARECKPALPFVCGARIVDFVMANVVRSGSRQLMVATQYRPETLNRHILTRWSSAFDPGALTIRDGRSFDRDGYPGTAAAVHRNAAGIDASGATEVVVLAGDHIYEMDYAPMVAAHRLSGAFATVATDTVRIADASAFGVLTSRSDGLIVDFAEKPRAPGHAPDDPGLALVSMGIYVFSWRWLRAMLAEAAARGLTIDFGHDVIPAAVRQGAAHAWRPLAAHGSRPYWRDVGTLDAYRLAQLDFGRPHQPCALPQGDARRSVPAVRSQIAVPNHASWSLLHESVIMPGAMVGAGVRLTRAILAPDVIAPDGLVVGEDESEDARWFRRTERGTTLVTAAMLERWRHDRRPAAASRRRVGATTAVAAPC